MWIESMNGFGIQCNTEGLQIDNAMKIGLTQASKIVLGT